MNNLIYAEFSRLFKSFVFRLAALFSFGFAVFAIFMRYMDVVNHPSEYAQLPVSYSNADLSIMLSEDGTITFSNTAAALSEVEVGRLFDRFYTVENAKNATGLGLSIARALVEQMHGQMNAAYEAGRLVIRMQI